jgi:hypothetical protein
MATTAACRAGERRLRCPRRPCDGYLAALRYEMKLPPDFMVSIQRLAFSVTSLCSMRRVRRLLSPFLRWTFVSDGRNSLRKAKENNRIALPDPTGRSQIGEARRSSVPWSWWKALTVLSFRKTTGSPRAPRGK